MGNDRTNNKKKGRSTKSITETTNSPMESTETAMSLAVIKTITITTAKTVEI